MKPLQVELFASGAVKPEALWALVADVRRLPEWSDADAVVSVDPEPVQVGSRVVTREGGRELTWTVITQDPRVLELRTGLAHGRLGIGVSVAREALGARARIVLAALYEPRSRLAAVRFRLLGAAALRRRFDAWTRRALLAAADAGDGS